MKDEEKSDIELLLHLKDEEIARQIKKRKLAQQTRNWVIILVIVFHLLKWML